MKSIFRITPTLVTNLKNGPNSLFLGNELSARQFSATAEQNFPPLPPQEDEKKFKHDVFVGRIQVVHIGHEAVIKEMIENAKKKGPEFKTKVVHVDLRPDNLNPHSTEQVGEMVKMLFPKEMESGFLKFVSLSSLETGGIKRKETWEKLAGGNTKDLEVFYGNKDSASDRVNGKHYMHHLADEFGFIPRPVTPILRNHGSKDDVSASSLLENPYHITLRSTVNPKVSKYISALWETAHQNSCLISDVNLGGEAEIQKAYLDFLKRYNKGKVLIPDKEGMTHETSRDLMLGKTMVTTTTDR